MPLGTEVGLGPSHIALDGDPAHPLQKRDKAPKFRAYVYCGKTAVWIKMTLRMGVGLGSGHIVLNGDQLHPPRGTTPLPIFGPCLLCQTAGLIKMPLCTEVDLGPDHIVLGRAQLRPQKGCGNFRPMSIVAMHGHPSQLLASSCFIYTLKLIATDTSRQIDVTVSVLFAVKD